MFSTRTQSGPPGLASLCAQPREGSRHLLHDSIHVNHGLKPPLSSQSPRLPNTSSRHGPHFLCTRHPGALTKGPSVRPSRIRSAWKALLLVQMYGNLVTSRRTVLETRPVSDHSTYLYSSDCGQRALSTLLCGSPHHLPLFNVSCDLPHSSVYSSLPASPHENFVFCSWIYSKTSRRVPGM